MTVDLLLNIIAAVRDCFEYDNYECLKPAVYNANHILGAITTLQCRLLWVLRRFL